jgi:hypothetical protein
MRKEIATFKHSAACFSKIEELNYSYKKKFNKNSNVELFYSRAGSDDKPTYSIAAVYEKADENELAYFESLLKQ